MSVPYHLGRFPPPTLDWARLIPLIGPANAAVARYEGVVASLPNPDVLLGPMTTQEAVLSSRIEGTQATLEEVLEFEAIGDPEDESTPKKADIREVLNYRRALRDAVQLLQTLPLSQRLLRATHQVLMDGVRGRNKAPGEYRAIANWIGPPGCSIEEARFVPVSAAALPAAMDRWEQFIHAPAPDLLVQLAIIHAEFEAIHPFLDGNGRLGRLLVPLFLYDKRLLSRPNLYISAYIEAHRDEYYDRLLAISRDDDWTGWCVYFLRALTAQADDNRRKAQAVLALYSGRKRWIEDTIPSQYAVRALDWLFKRPIFNTSEFVARAGIPPPTARRILRRAQEGGLLRVAVEPSGRRGALLLFPELLDIVEGGGGV